MAGPLVVEGDYRIQNVTLDGFSSGFLKMTTAADYVQVKGDFVMDSKESHHSHLSAGILEVWGDFTQKSSFDSEFYPANFNASGTHKVVLSGSAQQIVSFEDPNYSRFNILEIRNNVPGRVIFSTAFVANQILGIGDAVVIIATSVQTVPHNNTTFSLSGTANAHVVGTLSISNAANGAVSMFAAAENWNSSSISIDVGQNILTVTGTNWVGAVAQDSVTITREASSSVGDRYVSPTGGNVYPYTNWAIAANVLQDAVDAAVVGDTVFVTNGTYDTGGGSTPGYDLMNRVVVTHAITIQSVNGPEQTIILGAPDPGTGDRGDDAVRGAYLVDGASLIGFTVSNGYSRAVSVDPEDPDLSGGGLFLDHGGIIFNCVISDNSANNGGGVLCYYGGEVNHSTISDNSANYGGGVLCYYGGVINNSTIGDNSAVLGGGMYCYVGGTIHNSILIFQYRFFRRE